MTNEAKKIINWAANQDNAHGGHIDAIKYAIDSGRVSAEVIEELNETLKMWVKQHEARF